MIVQASSVCGPIVEQLSQLLRDSCVAGFIRIPNIACRRIRQNSNSHHRPYILRCSMALDVIFLCRQLVELATCFLLPISGVCDMFRSPAGGDRDTFSNRSHVGSSRHKANQSPKGANAKELFSNLLKTKGEHSSHCLLKNSSLSHQPADAGASATNHHKENKAENFEPASGQCELAGTPLDHSIPQKFHGSLNEQTVPQPDRRDSPPATHRKLKTEHRKPARRAPRSRGSQRIAQRVIGNEPAKAWRSQEHHHDEGGGSTDYRPRPGAEPTAGAESFASPPPVAV